MPERIFDLRLDVKNPDTPFAVNRSISVQSGDLVEVFSRFQIELVRLLRELHDEDLQEQLKLHGADDDVPF